MSRRVAALAAAAALAALTLAAPVQAARRGRAGSVMDGGEEGGVGPDQRGVLER